MTSGNNLNLVMTEPLGLCDLIGLAFRIWRTNLGLIFKTLIGPTTVYYLSATVIQWCFTYGLSGSFDWSKTLTMIAAVIVSLVFYVWALVYLSIQQLALVRLFTGLSPTFEKAIAYGRKKALWMIGLFAIAVSITLVIIGILACMMVFAGFLSQMGPAGTVLGGTAIVAAIGVLFVFLGLLTLLSLMGFSILACEETSFFGVITETFQWTFKYFGRVMCFGMIFYIVFSVISLPVSIPIAAATFADMTLHQIQTGATAADAKLSLGAMIFVQAWEGLSSLLLRPVTAISFALLFLDLRMRADGIDLASKLKTLSLQFHEVDHGIQGR